MAGDPPEDRNGRDEPLGGEAACFLDRVRDCCGTVEGEPHRRDCVEARPPSDDR